MVVKMNYKLIFLLVIIAAVMALFFLIRNGATAQGWRFASHEPTGTAPDPHNVREAVIQIILPVLGGGVVILRLIPGFRSNRQMESILQFTRKSAGV